MAGTRKKHRASSPSKRKGEGEEKIKEGEREREGGNKGAAKRAATKALLAPTPTDCSSIMAGEPNSVSFRLQRLDSTRN